MTHNAAPNVWTQMKYTPPRGSCNFKQSVLSPKCPCLRFMLHPLKSASSYECDGCGHHASFHSMENKTDDEIRKRWELEAKEQQEQEEHIANRPRKRLRQLEYANDAEVHMNGRAIEDGLLTPDDISEDAGRSSNAGVSRARLRKGTAVKKQTARKGTRSRGKVTELPDDDDEFIELD
ncbi:hypothetical protein EJ04DRAFT_576267 [Polyplosphaeria fusca]|uniref:Uncharacterized protein n=1 Tax=Polyplosphaeria fusca TaxID=682080 RepID=A0A9P4R247_9PLEO|nr:hypothetical protein EJ04DRAFT_576267 [Polyplosphaeria fusca]